MSEATRTAATRPMYAEERPAGPIRAPRGTERTCSTWDAMLKWHVECVRHPADVVCVSAMTLSEMCWTPASNGFPYELFC